MGCGPRRLPSRRDAGRLPRHPLEIQKSHYFHLCAQLYLNSAAGRIEARRIAASNRVGQNRLLRSGAHPQGNRGGAGFWPVAPELTEIVATTTIDSDCDFNDAFIVAKIDVEGHQDACIEGMRATLARNYCVMQVEAFDNQRERTKETIESVGLVIINDVYPDLFVTNIPELAAGG
jgi:FkbM family methyltransferase